MFKACTPGYRRGVQAISIFMKKLILATLAVVCLALSANAAIFKKGPKYHLDFNVWADTASNLPQKIDDLAVFYPKTVATPDTIAVISGEIKVPGVSAQPLMWASLSKVIADINTDDNEAVTAIDFKNNSFEALINTTVGSHDKELNFKRKLSVSTSNGVIKFTVSEILIKYRQGGLIPKTTALEELHPENNSRQKEAVIEFVTLTSKNMHDMAQYAKEHSNITITHFKDIENGIVVPGMNMEEVTLAKGPARDSRKSGERTRWIYSNDYVVIFTNGIVTKVIGE